MRDLQRLSNTDPTWGHTQQRAELIYSLFQTMLLSAPDAFSVQIEFWGKKCHLLIWLSATLTFKKQRVSSKSSSKSWKAAVRVMAIVESKRRKMQQTLMEQQKKELCSSLSGAWHFTKPPPFLHTVVFKAWGKRLREPQAEATLVSINVTQLHNKVRNFLNFSLRISLYF